MNEFAYIIVSICLTVINIIWLLFLRWILISEKTERWQLMERIREPDAEHVPIGDLINKTLIDKKKDKEEINIKASEPIFTDEQPSDEYDLVGQVNPSTPLREEDDK